MSSMDVHYARSWASPRASYPQDWISMDKGGGSWDRMLVPDSVRDQALTPRRWFPDLKECVKS